MKTLSTIIIALFLIVNLIAAQDTLYVYKSGAVISKRAVNEIDSMSFIYTPPATGTVTDIDGNLYHWITIGTQKWMVENLKTSKFRTGESITNLANASAWRNATFAAWCDYNNETAKGIKYGKLYNGYAVSDSRNIAPVGWHIPSDSEWTTLENFLIANGYNYDGSTTGNKIAKALAAKTDWVNYAQSKIGDVSFDLTTNNKTGFTALPVGARTCATDVLFGSLGYSACWWSSSAYNDTNLYCRTIMYYMSNSIRDYFSGNIVNGLSVRCIKD
jgi:uncharacterized protein (TIGR02145 family)